MNIIQSIDDSQLRELLSSGAVGVMLTDTIYGIVAQATNVESVGRLYEIKHREGKPGTIIAADIYQLADLGIERQYLDAVSRLWPNPLSIVVPAGPELHYLHQGMNSLAVRIPIDLHLRALLKSVGPLLTSSANFPGKAPANNVEEAMAYFADTIDFYTAGDATNRQPSTVARLNPDGTLEVLREGAVKLAKEDS